jgi:hypothetical protein
LTKPQIVTNKILEGKASFKIFVITSSVPRIVEFDDSMSDDSAFFRQAKRQMKIVSLIGKSFEKDYLDLKISIN